MRYIVVEKNGHGCCMVASVLDTSEKTPFNLDGTAICECFDRAEAEMIAAALNTYEERRANKNA